MRSIISLPYASYVAAQDQLNVTNRLTSKVVLTSNPSTAEVLGTFEARRVRSGELLVALDPRFFPLVGQNILRTCRITGLRLASRSREDRRAYKF